MTYETRLRNTKRLTIVEVSGEPDCMGRSRFTAFWWGYNPSLDIDGVRAQCFRTDLDRFVGTDKFRGQTVDVIKIKES